MAPRTLSDRFGRPYAALDELRPGQHIELDAGFDCMPTPSDCPTVAEVRADETGELFFECVNGRHYLHGQLDDTDHNTLVGVYPATNGCGPGHRH